MKGVYKKTVIPKIRVLMPRIQKTVILIIAVLMPRKLELALLLLTLVIIIFPDGVVVTKAVKIQLLLQAHSYSLTSQFTIRSCQKSQLNTLIGASQKTSRVA